MAPLANTALDVFPLCLGANVFGWTADAAASMSVLDAYTAAGGNFVDTADVYMARVPGNSGGESETIIGRWMAQRHNRDSLVIATKVGKMPGLTGLAPETIRTAAEASLRRLGTDRIDLYYAHADDPDTPVEETLGAFDALVREGKVRYIAASNFTAPRLAESLKVSERNGLASYVALQPYYNLLERHTYEGELAELCEERGIAVLPYYGLARGFLTGKYRPGGPGVDSPRAGAAAKYLEEERGRKALAALDDIAAAHRVPLAAVALAWLRSRPAVAAPIASARNAGQLAELLPMATLTLSDAELGRLTDLPA